MNDRPRLKKVWGQILFSLLITMAANYGVRAVAATTTVHGVQAEALARLALGPYTTAHAFRGAFTTTQLIAKQRSEITTTTSLQVICDANGGIERLRAQMTSWGHTGDQPIDGMLDRILIYDGATLWVYRPVDRSYSRSSDLPSSLPALVELPPVEAAWNFASKVPELARDERGLRLQQGNITWTLVINANTGHLRRIERVSGKGAQRTITTTSIRDLDFDQDVSLPGSLFAFTPPPGAKEEPTVIAASSLFPFK